MACGKPIIDSLSGEGRKIVEESKSGFVSEPDNYISFSNSIIKFLKLSEKNKSKLGLNARNYFKKEFNRGSLINKLSNFFNEK